MQEGGAESPQPSQDPGTQACLPGGKTARQEGQLLEAMPSPQGPGPGLAHV